MYEVKRANANKYNIIKDGMLSYEVTKKVSNWSCNCLGYKYRGTCKHLGMVEAAQPKRFPRAVITEALKDILPKLKSITEDTEVVGSYRREKADSKDIDVLMRCSVEDFRKVNEVLASCEGFEPVVSGDTIIRGYVQFGENKIEMDVNRLNENMNYYLTLEYRTGPAEHNIAMRSRAKKLGGSLNENKLVVDGVERPVNSEEDIYYWLGVAYQEPTRRTKELCEVPFLY